MIMMFPRPLSVESLNTLNVDIDGQLRLLREKTTILVLDDEIPPPLKTLINNGYNVQHKTHFNSMVEISGFQIYLCDLRDIGSSFDPKLQGAHLVEMIRRELPAAYIVAYSGERRSSTLAQHALKYADTFIKKDEPFSIWESTLDNIIREMYDPVKRWHRYRKILVTRDVPTVDILKLEHAWVKSILKRRSSFRIEKMDIGDEAKQLARGLSAATVFEVIKTLILG